MDQHPSDLEKADSLERCSCSMLTFEKMELLSLEGSRMLRMIELEVALAVMLPIAIHLPMVDDHHAFGYLGSFASVGGELDELHP